MTKLAGWMLGTCLVGAACGGDDVGSGNQATPVNTIALTEWKDAMTIADFHTAGMAVAWSTMKSADGKLCTECHNEYGSADEPYFFAQVQEDRQILLRFFAASNGKISVNTDSFARAANHQEPVPDHPAFDQTNAIGVKALQQFYMLTCAHVLALCG